MHNPLFNIFFAGSPVYAESKSTHLFKLKKRKKKNFLILNLFKIHARFGCYHVIELAYYTAAVDQR